MLHPGCKNGQLQGQVRSTSITYVVAHIATCVSAYHMYNWPWLRMCVRARVRARARACVCVCVYMQLQVVNY